MRVWILGLALVFVGAACPGRGGGGGGDDDDDGSPSQLVGAWHGDGPEFPDGQLCFIFCENGRFFSGDSTCDDTDRGDFACYSEYSVSGNVATVVLKGQELSIETDVSGDEATFTIDEVGDLPFTRVGTTSVLCDRDIPPPEQCCPYANDGFCDEPEDCPVGSDGTDCS